MFFFFQMMFLFSLKAGYYVENFFFFRVFIFFFFFLSFFFFTIKYFVRNVLNWQELELLYSICLISFTVMENFFFVVDLMTFFLTLEIINIMFYIFFVTSLNSKLITLIKYKSLLSNYL
jgi:hypothetical protein